MFKHTMNQKICQTKKPRPNQYKHVKKEAINKTGETSPSENIYTKYNIDDLKSKLKELEDQNRISQESIQESIHEPVYDESPKDHIDRLKMNRLAIENKLERRNSDTEILKKKVQNPPLENVKAMNVSMPILNVITLPITSISKTIIMNPDLGKEEHYKSKKIMLPPINEKITKMQELQHQTRTRRLQTRILKEKT